MYIMLSLSMYITQNQTLVIFQIIFIFSIGLGIRINNVNHYFIGHNTLQKLKKTCLAMCSVTAYAYHQT
jgi:hypothetical protein